MGLRSVRSLKAWGVLFHLVFEFLSRMSRLIAGQNVSTSGQNVSTKQKKLARVFVGEAVGLGPGVRGRGQWSADGSGGVEIGWKLDRINVQHHWRGACDLRNATGT